MGIRILIYFLWQKKNGLDGPWWDRGLLHVFHYSITWNLILDKLDIFYLFYLDRRKSLHWVVGTGYELVWEKELGMD